MIDSKGLSAFIEVLANRSFEKAAQKLCVTQSAVSQRLKSLEESLGQSLIIRSPKITATQAGEALAKYAHQLQQIEHAFYREIAPEVEQDWLKVSIATNADTLSIWLLDALIPWCKEHRVLLDLKIDDQDDTHHLLHTGEVIGCITSLDKSSNGTSVTEIGMIEYECVVSPEFYQKYFGEGVNHKSFEKAPIVAFNHKDQLQRQYIKKYFSISGERAIEHYIPSIDAHIAWIKAGMGFGLVSRAQAPVQPLLESGELVVVAPDKPFRVPLYWHQSGIKTELSRSLTRQIIKNAKLFQQQTN